MVISYIYLICWHIKSVFYECQHYSEDSLQAGKSSVTQNLASLSLSLYSTRTKLGSTLEAKLTLSSHLSTGRSRAVKSMLWVKVGLGGGGHLSGRHAI
jgi:hypothetical protein